MVRPHSPDADAELELGVLTRLVGFPLEDAAPGQYEIVMTFEDEVGARRVEIREPFSVVPAPPAAPATAELQERLEVIDGELIAALERWEALEARQA